jgi:hypothetical protein
LGVLSRVIKKFIHKKNYRGYRQLSILKDIIFINII